GWDMLRQAGRGRGTGGGGGGRRAFDFAGGDARRDRAADGAGGADQTFGGGRSPRQCAGIGRVRGAPVDRRGSRSAPNRGDVARGGGGAGPSDRGNWRRPILLRFRAAYRAGGGPARG